MTTAKSTIKIRIRIPRLLVIALFACVVCLGGVREAQAASWKNNPNACPMTDAVNYPGQNCTPQVMCGVTTGVVQCISSVTINPPVATITSATLYSALYGGGYILDCQAASDAAAPFCDNSGSAWCNRDATCFGGGNNRETSCVAGKWQTDVGAFTCGACLATHLDCLGDTKCEVQKNTTDYPTGANNHYGTTCLAPDARCDTGIYDCDATGVTVGNGCEATRTGACVGAGGFAGTWSCSVNAGGSCSDGGSNYDCSCTAPKCDFWTGDLCSYLTSNPLLWGRQYGTGDLIRMGNTATSSVFVVHNDGTIEMATTTAPADVTNQLYNLNGDLYWSGVLLAAGATTTSSTETFQSVTDRGNSTTNSIQFNGATSTGTFHVISNGVQTAQIDLNGDDGSGMGGSANIVLNGDGAGGGEAAIRMQSNGTTYGQLDTSGDVFRVLSIGTANLTFGTQAFNAQFFNATGRLGLGSTAPSSTLHVYDRNGTATTSLLTLQNTVGDAQAFVTNVDPNGVVVGELGDLAIDSVGGRLYIKESGSGTNLGWSSFATGTVSGGALNFQQVTDNGKVTTNSIQFAGGTSTGQFIVDTKFGIGTNHPVYVMDVHSNDPVLSIWRNALGEGIAIVNDNLGDEIGISDIRSDAIIAAVSKSDPNLFFYGNRVLNTRTDTYRVGINTTTPSSMLDLEGGAFGDAILTLNSDDGMGFGRDAGIVINSDNVNGSDSAYIKFNNNGVQNAKFYASPSGAGFDVMGNNYFQVRTNGWDRLTVEGNGHVGIGSSTPRALLTVDGKNTGDWRLFEATNENDPEGLGIGVDAYGGDMSLYYNGGNHMLVSTYFGNTGDNYDYVFLGDRRVTVRQTSGFVGIDTMSPKNRLDVNGAISMSSSTPATSTYALYNLGGQLYWNGVPISSASSLTDTDGDTRVQVEKNADEDIIRFDTLGAERMKIDQFGFIGMGTNAPLVSLLTVGPGAHEASSLSVSGIPGMLNIGNFRDQNGENVFRAGGSVAGNDLVVGFGDLDYGGIGTSMQVNYAENSIYLSHSDLRFRESNPYGEYVGFIAPALLSTSTIWTLPAQDGANGQVLATNGAGILSWMNGGGVSSTSGEFWSLNGNTNATSGSVLAVGSYKSLTIGRSTDYESEIVYYSGNGTPGTDNPGGALSFNSGFGDGSGNGGNFYLTAGEGGGTTGSGGSMNINAGSASNDGEGGFLYMNGGGGSLNGNGGGMSLIAGISGEFGLNGGAAVFKGGYSQNGRGGYVNIVPGFSPGGTDGNTILGYDLDNVRRVGQVLIGTSTATGFAGSVVVDSNNAAAIDLITSDDPGGITVGSDRWGGEFGLSYNRSNRLMIGTRIGGGAGYDYVDLADRTVTINSNGNLGANRGLLGINNSDPQYALDVNADVAWNPIASFANISSGFHLFSTTGTPEGAVYGNVGDIVVDPTRGMMYIKQSPAALYTKNGWVAFATSTGAVAGGGTLNDAYNFGGAGAGRQIYTVDGTMPVEIVNPGNDIWETSLALTNSNTGGGIAMQTMNNGGDLGGRLYFTDSTLDPANGTGGYMSADNNSQSYEFGYQTAGVRQSSFYMDYSQMALQSPGTQMSGAMRIMAANWNVPILTLAAVGNNNWMQFSVGTSTPEGRVWGYSGSLYTRTDGVGGSQQMYIKTTDNVNTGWVAMLTASSSLPEADTLQTVTDRGNSTTNKIQFAGGTSTDDLLIDRQTSASMTVKSANDDAFLRLVGNAGASAIFISSDNGSRWSAIETASDGSFNLVADGAPALYAQAITGFVGIGTNAPTSMLHVLGRTQNAEMKVQSTDGQNAYIALDFDGIGGGEGSFSFRENGTQYGILNSGTLASGRFMGLTGDSGASVDLFSTGLSRLHVANLTGDIGVGTLFPASRMHVMSQAVSTTAIMTLQNNAGDFKLFNVSATPEGRVIGWRGDLAVDSSNGRMYIKQSGSSTNTGWVGIATGTGAIQHWQKNTNILSPVDSAVTQLSITNNSASTLTGFKAVNTNDVSNYAGAVIEMKGSGADFTNNMYFGKYGAGFWIPTWAGNGVLATDKNLVLGALGAASIIRYQVGGSYSSPATVATMDSDSMDFQPNVNVNVASNVVVQGLTSSTRGLFVNTTGTNLYVTRQFMLGQFAALPVTGYRAGAMVYNTASSTPFFWNGSRWIAFATGTGSTGVSSGSTTSSWSLAGNTGTDAALDFIGTTDAQALAFKTNDVERLRITSGGNFAFGTNSPISDFDFYRSESLTAMFRNWAGSAQPVNIIMDGGSGSVLTSRIAGTDYGSLSTYTDVLSKKQYSLTAMNTASLKLSVVGAPDLMTLDYATKFIGIGMTTPENILHVNGGISISSTTPATTSLALYNLGGDLYWNGNPIATGTSAEVDTFQTVTSRGATSTKWIQFAGGTSTGSFRPDVTNTTDLGSNNYKWRRLYATNVYASGTVAATTAMRSFGTLAVDGNTALGNSATVDTVNFLSRIISNFVPSVNNTYSLGSSALRWKDLFAQGNIYASGTVQSATLRVLGSATATNMYVTNALYVNGVAVTSSVPTLNQVANKGNVTAKDIQFGGGTSTGALNVSNTLTVTGKTTLGAATATNVTTGNLWSTGNTTLNAMSFASATGTNFSILGFVNSDLSPQITDVYSLGTSTKRWLSLWAANANLANVTTTNLFASGIVSTTRLFVNGTEFTGPSAEVDTFQTVTSRGATSTKWIQFAGGTSTGSFRPDVTNTTDLGSNNYKWRRLYATNVYASGTVVATTGMRSIGTLTIDGNTTLGNLATADTVTFNSRIASTLNPNVTNSLSLGSSALRWKDLFAQGNIYASGTVQTASLRVWGSATTTNLAILGFVNSDVSPQITNVYSLGTTAKRWLSMWAVNVTTTNLYASGVVSTTQLYVNGVAITGAGAASSLQAVTDVGNVTTKAIQFAGATSTGSVDVVGNITNLPSTNTTMSVVGTAAVAANPIAIQVSGRYAYTVHHNPRTLTIIDVSNVAAPVQVGSVTVGAYPLSVAVSGRYAYTANFSDNSISVVDVSKPTNPVVVGTAAVGTQPNHVHISGSYLYVANNDGTLSIVDVSKPTAPVQIANIAVAAQMSSVYVSGRYAFMTSYSIGSLSVVDVTNPSAPVYIGATPVGANPRSVYVSGRYAYTANNDGTVTVVDVSNPPVPVQVANLTVGGPLSCVKVMGRYAYVSSASGNAIYIVDVSKPTAPVNVKTAVTNSATAFAVSGRYAYATNFIGSAISVVDISGTEVGNLMAGSVEAGNIQSRNDVIAQGNVVAGSSLTVGSGGIMSQGGLAVNGGITIADITPSFTSNTLYNLGSVLYWNGAPIGAASGTTGTLQAVTDSGNITTKPIQFAGGTSTAGFRPDVTNTTDLGSNNYKWRRLYATNVNASGTIMATTGLRSFGTLTVDGNSILGNLATADTVTFNSRIASSLVPSVNNTYSLGSSALRWKDAFAQGNIYASGTVQTLSLRVWGSATTTNLFASGTVSTTKLYVNGVAITGASVGGTLQSVTDGGKVTTNAIQFAGGTSTGNFVPNTTNALSLGTSAKRWSDMWAANVHIGTSTWDLAQTADGSLSIGKNGGTEHMRVSDSGMSVIGKMELRDTTTVGLSNPTSVYTQGNYVYVVSSVSNKLSIFDASNPSNIVAKDTDTTGLNVPIQVVVKGNYAYVMNSGSAQISIFDVSNPNNIVPKSNIAAGINFQAIDVTGNLLVGLYADSIYLYDVSDPNNIITKGSIDVGLGIYKVVASGNYTYTLSMSDCDVSATDISDPNNPINPGISATTNDCGVDLAYSNRYVYVAGWNALESLDFTNPFSPVHKDSIAMHVTTNNDSKITVDGNNIYVAGTDGVAKYSSLNGVLTFVEKMTMPGSVAATNVFATKGSVYVLTASNNQLVSYETMNGDLGVATNAYIGNKLEVMGDAKFAAQLVLGEYSASMQGLQTGAMVYNSASSTPMFWNGTQWMSFLSSAVASASSTPVTLTFQQVTDFGNTTNKRIQFAGATTTGSILPSTNNSLSLGNSTKLWNGLWSNTVNVGTSTSLTTPTANVLSLNIAGVERTRIDAFGMKIMGDFIEVGQASGGFSGPKAIAVQGDYAYIANAISGRLTIWDVSNPSAIVVRGHVSGMVGLMDVAVQGNYAYTVDGGGTISIFDVSNPDIIVAKDTFVGGSTAYAIDIEGNYLAVTSDGAGAVVIYDVSDPNNIVPRGAAGLQDTGSGLKMVGNYIYAMSAFDGYFEILDMTNPDVLVSLVNKNTAGYGVKLDVAGNFLYVLNMEGIIESWDISNVSAPVLVDTEYTWITSNDIAAIGGYVYTVDNNGVSKYSVANGVLTFLERLAPTSGHVPYALSARGSEVYVVSYAGNSMTAFVNTDGNLDISNNTYIGSQLEVAGDAKFAAQLVLGSYPGLPSSGVQAGAMIYNAASSTPFFWDGSRWLPLVASAASVPSGLSWSLAGNASTNPVTDFIGTTDAKALVFKTGNTERMRILADGKIGIGTSTPSNLLSVNGGVTLASTTPATTAMALYNRGGSLYWNGSPVTPASGVSSWTVNGNNVYSNNTGNVGVGTATPVAKLTVADGGFSAENIIVGSSNYSIISAVSGINGYTSFSGGIGTGPADTLRLTDTGNLVNIGSIQAGEITLVKSGTFAAKADYPVGVNPFAVATGDFNGDGKDDVVTANYNGNSISVLINNGDGTFAANVDYPSLPRPESVSVGDLNGDGKPDIAAVDYSNNAYSIWINNGNGTFAAAVNDSTGLDPQDGVLGDVNGDGKLDFIVASGGSNAVSVSINNGDGTFATRVNYPAGFTVIGVSVGDVNGDGKADIAACSNMGLKVMVLINNGNGTFGAAVSYNAPGVPTHIAMGDLNGDGRGDLVTGNTSSNDISVFINNGNGTFAAAVSYAAGTWTKGVFISDLNGDGKADIASTGASTNNISVFINKGNGTFAAAVNYAGGGSPRAISVGDFNGDGRGELVAVNYTANTVSVYRNIVTPMMYTQASTGNVGFGTTTPNVKINVVASGATVAAFDRQSSDGSIIDLRRDGASIGSVSVAAGTVSYNAFTGSHYAWTNDTIEAGAIVTLTNENRHQGNAHNSEIVYGITSATSANDPRVLGSYVGLLNPSDEASDANPHLVNAVGNGDIWVADKGQNIATGDYLITSDVAGHAMKDIGTYGTSYVFARAAEPMDWTQVTTTIDIQTASGTQAVKHARMSVFFESFARLSASAAMQPAMSGNDLQGNVVYGPETPVSVTTTVMTGSVSIVGHLELSKDSVGQALIMSGQTRVHITFENAYATLPVVTVTQVGVRRLDYGVENISLQGFDVAIDPIQYKDILFNWQAFGNREGRVSVSNGTTLEMEMTDMGTSLLETQLNAIGAQPDPEPVVEPPVTDPIVTPEPEPAPTPTSTDPLPAPTDITTSTNP